MPRHQKVARPVPLFVVCQRIGCEVIIGEVATTAEQHQGEFCSRRCAQLARRTFATAGQKGGLISGGKRTARLLERVRGLSPVEAYHLGYQRAIDRQWHRRHQTDGSAPREREA